MTVGKASALAAGFVGAVALGVAIGPTVQDKWSTTPVPNAVVTESAPAPTPAPAATRTRRVAPAPSVAPAREASRAAALPEGAVRSVVPAVWEPEVRDRVKKVLNRGTQLEIAAADFASAEEFVTVARAARNTNVPFMVLKHRVVTEQRSLADAIREAKPDLDAQAEVERARAEALADLDS